MMDDRLRRPETAFCDPRTMRLLVVPIAVAIMLLAAGRCVRGTWWCRARTMRKFRPAPVVLSKTHGRPLGLALRITFLRPGAIRQHFFYLQLRAVLAILFCSLTLGRRLSWRMGFCNGPLKIQLGLRMRAAQF